MSTNLVETPRKLRASAPRVLLVDDEQGLVDMMRDILGQQVGCNLTCATTLAEAMKIIERQNIDLLVVDLGLPDGNGIELIPALRKLHPLASTVVITGSPSVDRAVSALRNGAVDFLAKPFSLDDFLSRVRGALHRNAVRVKTEGRIDRLRVAVRRLNEARRLVTRKVDLLCNDLISAYGDLSRQFDMVRATESFRSALNSADDLEQMLCHAMDWMLRQLGYCNVAIFLAGEPGFQLGAYMKYTIPGEPPLIEALRKNLINLVAREGMLHLAPSEAKNVLSFDELKYLKDQTVVGAHCTYLGESLAQIILFREGDKPFTDDDLSTLRAVSPVFAWTLATMVKQNGPETSEGEPENPPSDGGGAIEDNGSDTPKPRKKKDDADWWKRGEQPPF